MTPYEEALLRLEAFKITQHWSWRSDPDPLKWKALTTEEAKSSADDLVVWLLRTRASV